MKEKIRIGYIGLGRRGKGMLKHFAEMPDVEIVTLSDLSELRLEEGKKRLLEKGCPEPKLTKDYREIINDPTLDAVVVMTGWSGRPAIAIESMRAGKYTAIEVGCADGLSECYDLIRTYEETGSPLMMLENCCYGRREMMLLRMVREGLFGELVHCTGGYQHYLNDEDLFKDIDTTDIPHYRLPHYVAKNRENYPTHAFGPIAKILGINRGNRMVRLTSVATKSVGLKAYAEDRFGADSPHATTDYLQGDIVNTVITCENGETVLLTLDTTLPRAYYSRNLSIRGTKGMSSEERKVVFLKGMKEGVTDNEGEMFEQYDHPLHAEYVKKGVKTGHGGMDWLVCRAFVESVKNGTNTPIDAYDTVSWMAIGPLSEESIAKGGAPVEFPDFTNGRWKDREPIVEGKYCLDKVCEDGSVSVV